MFLFFCHLLCPNFVHNFHLVDVIVMRRKYINPFAIFEKFVNFRYFHYQIFGVMGSSNAASVIRDVTLFINVAQYGIFKSLEQLATYTHYFS